MCNSYQTQFCIVFVRIHTFCNDTILQRAVPCNILVAPYIVLPLTRIGLGYHRGLITPDYCKVLTSSAIVYYLDSKKL